MFGIRRCFNKRFVHKSYFSGSLEYIKSSVATRKYMRDNSNASFDEAIKETFITELIADKTPQKVIDLLVSNLPISGK
jgi:hypothetical protein